MFFAKSAMTAAVSERETYKGSVNEHPDYVEARSRLSEADKKLKTAETRLGHLQGNFRILQQEADEAAVNGGPIVNLRNEVQELNDQVPSLRFVVRRLQNALEAARLAAEKAVREDLDRNYTEQARKVYAALGDLQSEVLAAAAIENEAERRGSSIGGIRHPVISLLDGWKSDLREYLFQKGVNHD